MTDAEVPIRAFKTAWFAKVARNARISDEALCEAITQVRLGLADNLGGGVRTSQNPALQQAGRLRDAPRVVGMMQ